jgi:hypothetical protein
MAVTLSDLENNIKINLNTHTLHRGVAPGGHTYLLNAPQWFSHNPNHDYIVELKDDGTPRRERRTVTVQKDITVINLKHPLIHNLLNIAIDNLDNTSLTTLVNTLNSKYRQTDTENYISDMEPNNIKKSLKSVYGGVSLHDQFKAMSDKKIQERMTKIEKLTSFLKQSLNMSSFRYSFYKYDRLLVILIVQVFSSQYQFFKDVKGWYHSDWQTPWHDKYKDKSQVFITEVVMYVDRPDMLEEGQTTQIESGPVPMEIVSVVGGGKKLLSGQQRTSKKMKATIPKGNSKARTNEGTNRVRPSSGKVARPQV